MIRAEEKSRTTHENAVYGAEILRTHGIRKIVLVTEAYHMPRSERCFRNEALEVTPAACNFRRFAPSVGFFMPGWKAIEENELALHEGVGLLFYWARGWI